MVTPTRIAETVFVTPDEMRYLKDVFETSVADRNILRASDDALRLAAFIMEAFGRRSMDEAGFLEAVRLFDAAPAERQVAISDATKVLLANAGIDVLDDGKLAVATDVAVEIEAGDAWNEGRAAYRADPIQGSLRNPYPHSGVAHKQWAAGMNEKTMEATVARLRPAPGSASAQPHLRKGTDGAGASSANLRETEKRRAHGPATEQGQS